MGFSKNKNVNTTSNSIRERRRTITSMSLMPFLFDMEPAWCRPQQRGGGARCRPTSHLVTLKSGPAVALPMEVSETDEQYTLTVDVPGIAKENVKVSVDDGILKVQVQHEEERSADDEQAKVHWTERSYGQHSRAMRLPDNVVVQNISAGQRDGVLTITLPKTVAEDAAHPKEIQIQ